MNLSKKHKVIIGVLLCLGALILLHNQNIFLGFPAFLAGFYFLQISK